MRGGAGVARTELGGFVVKTCLENIKGVTNIVQKLGNFKCRLLNYGYFKLSIPTMFNKEISTFRIRILGT